MSAINAKASRKMKKYAVLTREPRCFLGSLAFSWEQREVGDLLIERSQQAPMSDEYPLMAFIANEGVAPKGERYDRSALVTDTVNKLYKKTEKGDFIYSSNNLETGSIGLNKYGKACISPVYSIFEPTGIADSDFLGRRLVRKDFINAMVKWRQGVIYGQWRIHESDFLKIEISVPSVEEQRKIGAYLDQLDNLITLHQRKFEKLTNVKKSMLEKMFPQNGSSYPEIRFKGFTDPWEQRKLSEVATFGGGHTPPMADPDNYEDGYVLWVTSQDVKSNYLDRTTTQITEKGAKELTLYPAGSLVMVTRSGILRHTLPVAELRKPSTVNQDIRVILPQGECCGEWLLQFFISHNKELLLEFGKTGTTVESVDFGKIKDMLLYMPSTVEQQQIGDFFAKLDSLITLHQRKYDKLTKVKKAMLEKMFPENGSPYPEIRFKGFTDAWEQRKLSDMVERVTRKNENRESELPLTISAQYGLIDQNEFFDKRIASRDVSGYYLLKKGEFAYNKSTSSDAPWGAVKRLDRYEMGVLSTLYIVFALKENGNIDSDFLVSYYDTDCWHKGVQAIAAEGARNHGLLNITPADYFETVLTVPSDVKEQHQIGSFFAKLDTLITLHQRKLEKLKNIKKACLEKMFV